MAITKTNLFQSLSLHLYFRKYSNQSNRLEHFSLLNRLNCFLRELLAAVKLHSMCRLRITLFIEFKKKSHRQSIKNLIIFQRGIAIRIHIKCYHKSLNVYEYKNFTSQAQK